MLPATGEPINDASLELVKKKLFMSIAQGFESNSEMADYYMASLHEIVKHGALIKEEEAISALTSVGIQHWPKIYL